MPEEMTTPSDLQRAVGLKDCPICGPWEMAGFEPRLVTTEDGSYVMCPCGLRTVLYIVPEDAVRKWNTRSPQPDVEELRRENQSLQDQLKEAKARAEQTEAACAERDEALRQLKSYLIGNGPLTISGAYQTATDALKSTSGQNYIHKDKVREILAGALIDDKALTLAKEAGYGEKEENK